MRRVMWAGTSRYRLFADPVSATIRCVNITREQITHPDRSYRFLHLELDTFAGQRHRHRQIELTWIEQGVGLRFVGDSVMPFGPGDLVLLGTNLPHAWVSTPQQRGQPHVASVLQFAPELLEQPHLPELARARPLVQRAARGLRVPENAARTIAQRLKHLREHDGLRGVATLIDILALLVQHLDSMQPRAQRALRAGGSSRPDHDSRVARVIDWVHGNLSRELALAEAAQVAHVSPAAFSRFFSREVGKNFTQYLNDLRCSEACLQLRGSSKPVALIANDCGFATMSHFNRQFRLRTGATPREFRSRSGAVAATQCAAR